LIQNLLAQNPDFYCTPTSGLADLVLNARGTYNNSQAMLAQNKDEMQSAFLNYVAGGINGYFNGLTNKPFIVDKSREWGINYGLINMINPEPKIICMVRDIRSIYSSMEKNFRKNPHRENHVQDVPNLVGTTLNKRVDIWAGGVPVGVAIDRLQDVIQQGIADKMLFVRYEDLMDNPENEMKRIYEYFGIPEYDKHDFENITQHTQENDMIHGIYGDHTLRTKFERKPDDFMDVLGYEISMNIRNHYKWFYDYFGYV
jgi:sulfotransferase